MCGGDVTKMVFSFNHSMDGSGSSGKVWVMVVVSSVVDKPPVALTTIAPVAWGVLLEKTSPLLASRLVAWSSVVLVAVSLLVIVPIVVAGVVTSVVALIIPLGEAAWLPINTSAGGVGIGGGATGLWLAAMIGGLSSMGVILCPILVSTSPICYRLPAIFFPVVVSHVAELRRCGVV